MPKGVYKRKPFSREHREAISRAIRGDKHPRWITNPTAEQKNTCRRRFVQKYGRANTCDYPYCERKTYNFSWVNVSGLFKLDRSDWSMLCSSCIQLVSAGADRAAELFGEPNKCERPGCITRARTYRWHNKLRTDCDIFDRANWEQLCNYCYKVQRRADRWRRRKAHDEWNLKTKSCSKTA